MTDKGHHHAARAVSKPRPENKMVTFFDTRFGLMGLQYFHAGARTGGDIHDGNTGTRRSVLSCFKEGIRQQDCVAVVRPTRVSECYPPRIIREWRVRQRLD